MGFIQAEARGLQTLLPSTLDDLIPDDHVCRVIEAFVGRLEMGEVGFMRAEPAENSASKRVPYQAAERSLFFALYR